ncbi:hypothetical protein SLEP1_g35927 [Rubroshorea leprosula]|uniref:Uncharacterized protein n=1 Tax=Rubroshorea leprosula TaxID=152421 RepID=A0AAV5KQ25_9ROSI|nr:hypothetical protein SLEP1_g35927 [Rubroshorea leprosula]
MVSPSSVSLPEMVDKENYEINSVSVDRFVTVTLGLAFCSVRVR